MNISKIIKDNPELSDSILIKVPIGDLKVFAMFCFDEGKKENPPPQPDEELLTTDQFAEMLKISKVCLWHWDKKGITNPVRIGNTKRYRRSDLDILIKK